MELRGWDYTGRNIGPELHKQFLSLADCLLDPEFTNHCSWGKQLQERLTTRMMMSSPGALRTLKRVCINFGFLNADSFNNKREIDNKKILTQRGRLVHQAAKLEQQVTESLDYDSDTKSKIYDQIKRLYEEAYCCALKNYYIKNNDNTKLHPLRATLKALKKYSKLDKWEWYLLNTCIRHDDDKQDEKKFDEFMRKYRNGEISFSMDDVVEKQKGHQYIPQYFEFAGLMCVTQRPIWSISDSGRYKKLKEDVLKPDFLVKLYGGTVYE